MNTRTAPQSITGVDPPAAALSDTDELIPLAECGWCTLVGRDDGVGLCPVCRRRIPRGGGCGAGLWLVAAIAGEGETGAPLAHLIHCPACRTFFDRLAALVACAAQEAAHREVPHAGQLAGTSA